MAAAANYHIFLFPEPPGPPTYLCLLCPLADCTEADILAHVALTHGVTPVPTPMAANPPRAEEETGVLRAPQQEDRRTPAMDSPSPDEHDKAGSLHGDAL